MSFLQNLKKLFTFSDLRNRILYTLGILILIRIFAHIPLPGVNLENLQEFFNRNQIFGLLNMFSGGAMQNFSIIMMGVGPYITATIVMQLLQMIIPRLDALSKEGEYGQRKMNQYTRILTVPLAAFQAYAMINLLSRGGAAGQQIITGDFTGFNLIIALVTITAGTMFLMWLGEIISENGIGNGISLIITLGIIAGIPAQVRNTLALITSEGAVDTSQILKLAVFGIIAIITIGVIVLITEGQRNIPVSYARRVRGPRIYGGVDTHLPLRVNQGGVIPIIFAMSIMLFPSTIAKYLEKASSPWLASFAQSVSTFFANNLYYGIIYFVLVFAFTYFYTGIVFNPSKVSENLQKQGGFIPGVRPGEETIGYLKKILGRINFAGGLFLGIVAVLPFLVQSATGITTLALGGTGILIVVSVVLDTSRQIKSQLLMRSYEY
jgi:preprotein translocase subunit SecY